MTYASLLTQEQVQRTHDASLEILENVGLLVRNEKARAVFERHGCRVDKESLNVKLPVSVVKESWAKQPPTFTFPGPDRKYDRAIARDPPILATGRSAPDIITPITGRERPPDS